MARPDLRNMQVKERDLVLLVYDNPKLVYDYDTPWLSNRGALVMGMFNRFLSQDESSEEFLDGPCGVPQDGSNYEFFCAYPCVVISAPKDLWLTGRSLTEEENIHLQFPRISEGQVDSRYMTCAERIYIGKDVKKALREDPIAKYLLPYPISLDSME